MSDNAKLPDNQDRELADSELNEIAGGAGAVVATSLARANLLDHALSSMPGAALHHGTGTITSAGLPSVELSPVASLTGTPSATGGPVEEDPVLTLADGAQGGLAAPLSRQQIGIQTLALAGQDVQGILKPPSGSGHG